VAATIHCDVAKGFADLDASIRIDDRHWAARGVRGRALASAGRLPEAIADVRSAFKWNPRATWIHAMRAQYRFFAGGYDAALVEAREAIRLFPTIDRAYVAMSMVASGPDLHDEAIVAGRRALELAPHTPFAHTSLACALARAGLHEEAVDVIRRIEASRQGIESHLDRRRVPATMHAGLAALRSTPPSFASRPRTARCAILVSGARELLHVPNPRPRGLRAAPCHLPPPGH
jgi:hypothetical protein